MVDPRRLLWICLPLLLAFRLWLAAALPITGDEAYFIWWGRLPDWGFYDHPPMIGWWLAAQLPWGQGALWLRLTAVLQPFFLAGVVAWAVPRIWPGAAHRNHGAPRAHRAYWAALLILLSPPFVWNVLITTDTPLIYFSVLSGLCWLRARRDDALPAYLASGLFLAGAVLSKYFVAFLGFAYLVDVVLRPTRRGWAGVAIAYACCLPALALMGMWNAGHCWPNFMFNFVNRHENAAFGWKNAVLYGVMMLYLLTPPVAWLLVRRGVMAGGRSLLLLGFVPLALFGLLSLEKTVGLHWVLSFLPFILLIVALGVPETTLRRLTTFLAGFALLHAAVIGVLALGGLDRWQGSKWYDSTVLAFEAPAIAARLAQDAPERPVFSNGYADAVTLGHAAGRYVGVFGEGTSHARHDDLVTDFHALDGRDLLIIRKSEPAPDEYAPYFRSLRMERFVLHGVTFYEIFGQGFDYARYRDTVLSEIRRKYYRIPAWLPQTGCSFCERYWPGEPCCR